MWWNRQFLVMKEQNASNNLADEIRCLQWCFRPEIFDRLSVQRNDFEFLIFLAVLLILLCSLNPIEDEVGTKILNCWTWTNITPQNFFDSLSQIRVIKSSYFSHVDFSHRNVRVTEIWSPGYIYNVIWVT